MGAIDVADALMEPAVTVSSSALVAFVDIVVVADADEASPDDG